jgi:hypothetical protein
MHKKYLGDSVYADFLQDGTLQLTIENGEWSDPSNTIFLEEDVYRELVRYVDQIKREVSRGK